MAFFGLFGKNRNKTETNKKIEDIIGFQNSQNPILNSEFNTFRSITRDIENIITNNSEISKVLDNPASTIGDFFTAINSLDVLPVITNKYQRLQQWRNSSAFPEVDFCLKEIADDFLHFDENGDFIHLNLNDKKQSLNETRRETIQNEFKKYISLFNFRKKYFDYVKRFLIEGELAWENIINPNYPELGIRAVKFIPTEYYETLVDKKTGERVGIFIDAQKLRADINSIISSSYYNSYKAFNAIYGTTINSYSDNTCIPFLWPQITYISSSETTPDGLVPLSLLEKCKQAYFQLALMQDAALIMRITRAPEKLLFNIDISNMSPKIAQDYVRRFGRELQTKKIVGNPNEISKGNNDGSPNITSVYHPSSMNTMWVFGKAQGTEGTTVETVGSTANFEQLEDIDYFLRRLLKQASIPYSRYKTPENTLERNDTISYEEYSFSRQEIRFQQMFADGFEKGFITHLKLRGLWSKYELYETDIQIEFTPPVLYDLYQNQKLLEAKMTAYATIADREEFSKIYAMKNILKMSDEEINENYENLVREGMLMKKVEWAQDQFGEKGPKDDSLPIPLKGDKEEESEGNDSEGNDNVESDDVGDESEDESSDVEDSNVEEGGEEGETEESNSEETENDEGESSEEGEEEENTETQSSPPPGFGLG